MLQDLEGVTSRHYPRAREVKVLTQLPQSYRVQTGVRRATLASLILAATLGVLLVFSGAASAAALYTVKLKVPRYVNVGQGFKLEAAGTASSRSHLTVFLAHKPCAASAAAETKRAVGTPISTRVLHRYASAKAVRAKPGTFNVCAYLTSIGQRPVTRAHASATYYVLTGGY